MQSDPKFALIFVSLVENVQPLQALDEIATKKYALKLTGPDEDSVLVQ